MRGPLLPPLSSSKQTQEKATQPLNPPRYDRPSPDPSRSLGSGLHVGNDTPDLWRPSEPESSRTCRRQCLHRLGGPGPEKLSVAFLTNQMTDMNTAWERFRVIGNKVYECLEN